MESKVNDLQDEYDANLIFVKVESKVNGSSLSLLHFNVDDNLQFSDYMQLMNYVHNIFTLRESKENELFDELISGNIFKANFTKDEKTAIKHFFNYFHELSLYEYLVSSKISGDIFGPLANNYSSVVENILNLMINDTRVECKKFYPNHDFATVLNSFIGAVNCFSTYDSTMNKLFTKEKILDFFYSYDYLTNFLLSSKIFLNRVEADIHINDLFSLDALIPFADYYKIVDNIGEYDLALQLTLGTGISDMKSNW